MADSLTIVKANGQANETGIDPTNSGTATGVGAKMFLIGPPFKGAPNTRGKYAREIAGASGQFRWLYDETITGASPTTYSYVGLPT